jgi:hypothetical protein
VAANNRSTSTERRLCSCVRPGAWAAAELAGGRGYSVVLGDGRQHPGGANAVVHEYYSSVQVRILAVDPEER